MLDQGWQAMGIRVHCPNGHVFKVKDKYAGKKGRCPFCEGRVVVQVPDLISTTSEAVKYSAGQSAPRDDPSSSSIFDEMHTDHGASSGSLLSGSVIHHKTVCAKCGDRIPLWFARCPACGEYVDHRR